jgi:tetratricopeptide (TPR) repeat protein
MSSLRGDVERAREEYRLSHWEDAERVLLRPLRALQGMLAAGSAEDETTVELLYANAWTVLGRSRTRLGHPRQAHEAFRQALVIFDRPSLLDLHGTAQDWADYGMALENHDRDVEAAQRFRRAVELDGATADVCRHLGFALRDSDPAEAEQFLRLARDLLPDDPDAIRALAEHIERDRPEEAAELLSQAAFGYASHGDVEDALALFDRRLGSDPGDAQARAGRAEMLRLLDTCEQALVEFDRSLELAPDVTWVMAGKGAALHRMSRNDEALAILDATLAIAPEFAFARGTKGRVLRALGNLPASAEILSGTPAHDPSAAWILADLGETLRLMNRDVEALQALDRAIDLMPRDAFARACRAAIHVAHGDRSSAMHDLDRALTLQPDSAFAHSVDGQIRYDSGDYDGAVEALERAVDLDSMQPQYLSMFGDSLRMVGRREEALAVFENAIELAPTHSGAWVGKGALLHELGSSDEGLAAVDHALELEHGTYPLALSSRGHILNDLGDKPAAERSLRLSLELDARQPLALAALAQIVWERGQAVEAFELADRALALNPEITNALVVQARSLRASHDPVAAAAKHRQIVELEPNDPWHHAELGDVLLEAGDAEGAISALDRALELEPEHWFALATKGQVLRAQGHAQEAVALLAHVVEQIDDEPWILTELGEALRLSGRNDEALAALDAALAIEPDDPWALAGRGSALHALQRYEEAIEYFDRALVAAPDATFAKSAKAALLVDTGQYREAAALLAALEPAVAGSSWALMLAGRAYMLAGDGARALRAYRAAHELEPDLLACERGYAEALLLQGDYEAARAAYRRIVEWATAATTIAADDMSSVGLAYLRLGQLDHEPPHEHLLEAVRYFGNALAVNDDIVPLQFDLGLALLSAGRSARAKQAYDRGIATARRAPSLRRRAMLGVARTDLTNSGKLIGELATDADARLISELLGQAIATAEAEIERGRAGVEAVVQSIAP